MKRISLLLMFFIPAIAGWAQNNGPFVQVLDPSLNKIISPDAKLVKLDDYPEPGTRETTVWVPRGGYWGGGYLAVSERNIGTRADVPGPAEGANIVKWDPKTGKISMLLANCKCAGLAVDKQGRIIVAVDFGPGAIMRIEKDGKQTILASENDDKQVASPNGVYYAPNGALYVTDPGHNPPVPGQVRSVYILKEDGKLTRVSPTPAAEIKAPNGLAFSPDGKLLYATDNPYIDVYDVQPDGTIANGRHFIDLDHGAPLKAGFPDEVRTDAKGNVYSTAPDGIWIMSPQGKHVGTVLVSDHPATMASGDPRGKTLFIGARPGLYRIPIKVVELDFVASARP